MKKLLTGFAIAFTLATGPANAWTIFSLGNVEVRENSKVDVYVIGYGKELGTQFLNTAVTKSRMQQQAFPDRAQLFMWALEKNEKWDADTVRKIPGAKVLATSKNELSQALIVAQLKNLKKISSLHLVGHSSATAGFGMQPGKRFVEDRKELSPLKKNFTDDAYVFLHGCNNGFISAPVLSSILEVPVIGSLTSTDFQQLHRDGTWYWNNPGQFPAGGWSPVNTQSFTSDRSCSSFACHRLKPNNHPYVGSWGKYETGLPFYKAFCNFNTTTRSGKAACDQGLRQTMKTWPSVLNLQINKNTADFKKALKDFLCPTLNGRDTDKVCHEVLDHFDRTGSVLNKKFFFGTQTPCTMNGCQVERFIVNTQSFGKVPAFRSADAGNRTLVNEYKLYLDLFNQYGL
jgi:hypothetical protein